MGDGVLLMIDEEMRKKEMGGREEMRRGKVERKGDVINGYHESLLEVLHRNTTCTSGCLAGCPGKFQQV